MMDHQPTRSIKQVEGTTNKGNPLHRHKDINGSIQYVTVYPSTARSGSQVIQVVQAMSDGLQLGRSVHSHDRCPEHTIAECSDHALTDWLKIKELHQTGQTHALLTHAWKQTPTK